MEPLAGVTLAVALSLSHSTQAKLNEPIVEVMEVVQVAEVNEVEDTTVNQEDIDLLAHLLYAEAGSSWIDDTTIYYVGSVALNRVNSSHYPNSLREVVYQRGQYACTWDGNIEKEPTLRCYEIAEELLHNGSILPDNVLYQAQFKQGSGVYDYRHGLYFCFY